MSEQTKSKWLQEVEDDAVRIQTKRFNDHFEEMEYQKSKTAEEVVPVVVEVAPVATKTAPLVVEDKKGKQ